MELSPIRQHFDLQISLLQLDRQMAEAETALRQAKYNLREAKVAQAEYGGSFKRFRDKLTGKQEEAETALRHAAEKAEATLASARQEYDALTSRLSELREQLSLLPDWESRNDGSKEWHHLEAMYCAQMLKPRLEITHELLLERRAQFNGTYAGQIKSHMELADIYSAPEAAGEACRPYLLRLKAALEKLDISLELHSFFDSPAFFLSSATQFTRMDRINTAITQAETLQRQLIKLQKELSE
jgi:hypothetical protein